MAAANDYFSKNDLTGKTFCPTLKSLIFDKLNTSKRSMKINSGLSTF